MTPQTARKELKEYILKHGIESLIDKLVDALNEVAKKFKSSEASTFWLGVGERFNRLHRWVVRK